MSLSSHMGLLQRGLLLLGLAAAAFSTGACSSEIGDSCSTNVECSPNGDRICDTAQYEGYCTVQGCSAGSCSSEAVCVVFYPVNLLSIPCDPATEDAVDPTITATDHCRGDQVCLSSGFCAQASLENRFCMFSCEDDSDCRSGYECRSTGTSGAEPALDPDNPTRRAYRFCAQRP